MDGLAHLLDERVSPLLVIILIFAVIVLCGVPAIYLIVDRIRKFPEPQKVPRSVVAAGIVFAGIVGAEVALVEFVKYEAWTEIGPQLTSEIESVTVNGTQISNGDRDLLVAALRNMPWTTAHHSHPTTCYTVLLRTSRGSLQLDLGRDSDNPQEYWVFYPLFHITRLNEVGHAFTNALDGNLPVWHGC